ncbi:MAG: protein-export chaperone SecB [Ferruginibacter sp.]
MKMMGLFEKTGDPLLTEEAFKKVNAPAIIYPFIREHLHNICLKGGIASVLLPTVNFKL